MAKGDRETGSLPGGSSSASMGFLLAHAGLRSAAACSHPCCLNSDQLHAEPWGSEDRSDCFWKTELTLLTVPLSPCSSSPCGSPSFGGFSWCSPASHPPPWRKIRFHTKPGAKPITATAMRSTYGFGLLAGPGSGSVPGHSIRYPSWQEPVRRAGGEQGIASPCPPCPASAHKAAGVGCLLFSLQPGM